MIVIVFVVCH